MRGAFRGMFRFGCSGAYGAHSYSVGQEAQGLSGGDNIEFRSYLYQLISQASEPRLKEEKPFGTMLDQVFRTIRIGPEALDVLTVGVGCTLILGILLGGCYLLGWVVDAQARQARLQYAQEYAVAHPQVVQEFMPQQAPQYALHQPAQYHPDFGVPAAQAAQLPAQGYGIAGGAHTMGAYMADSSVPASGTTQNQQTYMYWR